MDIFQSEILNTQQGVKHCFTQRRGGVSSGKYSSLNLSSNSGDSELNVHENRRIVSDFLDVSEERLIFPEQCHTSNVELINGTPANFSNTDGLITSERQLAIGVLSADCVPILFFDPQKRAIGASHAGWRGSVDNIVQQTLELFRNNYSTDVADLIVCIGPCIQQANYEVGEEVLEKVKRLKLTDYKGIVENSDNGKGKLDLQELNRQLLLQQGVQDKNIEIMRMCTFQNPDVFFSARRDGFNTGRFGAVIVLE